MKVLIGTKNQGKIEGAKKALEHYFTDVELKGIPVESNVNEQPLNDEIYNVELYNYYDNVIYAKDTGTVTFGNDTPDETMLVVKFHKDLTVEEGVTLTAKTRKKGMYICVLGDLVNEGEITMTKKRSRC